MIGVFTVLSGFLSNYSQMVTRLSKERAQSTVIASSVDAVWSVSGSDITVQLESRYSRSILLTGIAILWSGSSLTIVDRWNGTSNVNIVVEAPDGNTYTVQGFPVGIGPGYRVNVTLTGYASGRRPVTVQPIVGGSPSVIAVPAAAASRSPRLLLLNATALDCTATWLGGAMVNGAPITALIVAPGGSTRIDLYNASSTNVAYLYSIDAYTVFNCSADIAYDTAAQTLYLVNTSGVCQRTLDQADQWQLLNTDCAAQGPGARAEVLATANGRYLLVIRGGGSSYCIIQLGTPGGQGRNTQLGIAGAITAGGRTLEAGSYTVSAACGDTAYILLYDAENGEPYIASFNATGWATGASAGWTIVAHAPGRYSTGMACTGTELWILYERGSLYTVDTETAAISYVPVELPFYPWGPGDRLEYTDNTLVFARGDGTAELWLISA